MTSLLANVTLPDKWELASLAPELLLAAAVAAVLLLPLFLPKRTPAIPLVAALAAFAASAMAADWFLRGMTAPCCGARAGFFCGSPFGGLLLMDGLAGFARMLIYLFLALVCVLWILTARNRPGEKSAADAPEFFTLLLSAAAGMGFMISTGNLLMMLIGLELASLPSYVMAGFQKDKRSGAEAALKYVVFGAASAAVMIYGISLLYGVYGTLDAGAIGLAIAGGQLPVAACIGLMGLGLGIAFKISAFPMHFWCPDVFEGANVEVTTFLSVASKAAGLTLMLRLALALAGAAKPPLASTFAAVLGAVAALTATVGNLGALAQNNMKRLLAYSSIAHAGYALMAVAILSGSSGISALLLYLLVYLFMNLGAFSVVAVVFNHTGSEQMSALAGLGRRAPVLAVCMCLFMFSLVGVPPMAGFFAKFQLFKELFVYEPYSLRWLVAIGLVNTLISLFYYMRVVKTMFLQTSDAPPLRVGLAANAWVVILALPVTAILLAWQPLSRWAEYFAAGLLHAP